METDKLMEKAGGKAQDQDVLSKKLSLKISVVGYMKFQMVHGRLVPIGGKILISLKFKGEYCQQFPTTLVPTYAAVTLGADASAEGEIEKPVIDYPVPYYTDLIIKAEPYGKGAIGVGIHDLVGIEGSVKLSFPISWRPLVKFAKVKYEMQLGAKAYIGPYALNLEELDIFNYDGNLFVKNPDNEFISTEDYFRAQKDQKELENQEAELYDGPSAGSEEGEGGAESGTSAECRAGMAYAMLYQPQNYVLRKQAPEEKDSVYPDARQMIVTAGDTTMMVYLSQDKDRADADSTVAVYSVLRDGEWTDPRPICDDRTADFHPYAAVADGKIYVSWQNACRTFGEEEVDLARFGRYTGIESAVYDPDEDAFTVLGDAIGGTAGAEEESAGDSSTAGSRNAYFNVKTVSAEGKLIRLWQENTDGNLLGTSGTNSLLASSFTDGKWTDPAVLADGLGMIGGYAVWYEDGILYVAYSEKTGTDYQVTDDYEIGLSEWKIGQGQVTGSRITDDPEGARTMDYGPYFAEEDGQLALYWIRDNESMRKILTAAGEDEDPAPEEGAGDAEGEAAQAPAAADTGTLAAAADRKTLVTKNGTFVLFRGSCPEDDDASEVWTQQYLGEGRYSSPVRLTKLKMSLNCFTASPLEDGGILLVCEGRDILPAAGSGDEVKYSGCHFTTVTVSPAIDLAVENADPILFDPAYPGAPVHIHASVRNEGTFPASEGYLVQLLDKTTGEVVSTSTVYEGLGVGESREETIDFYLPLSFAGTTYQIVVTPRIGKDGDESNNTADVEAPGRSLSLDSLSVRRTGNYAYIVIRTENTGAADLEDVSITVSADKAGNEIIGTPISIGTIRHGKTVISSFEIDDLQKTLTFDEENMARLFVTVRAGDVSDMSSCYVFLEKEMSEGQKAADQVTSAIEALGDISLDKKEDVEKARALYNSLDDDARKLVSDQTLATLEEAEKEIIRLEGEKEAAEKAAAEKAAAEKAAAEKAAAEKAAAEKAAAEKAAAEKAAAEKAAAEKAAAEKAAKEKAAAEKAELLSSAPVLPAASVPMKLKQKTNAVFVTGLSSKDYVTGWTSSNPKIVKVTKKGKLGAVLKAGKKKGKAVITVTLASGKTASIVVKTQKKKVATKKIRISCGKKLVLKKGQSLSIGASLVPITSQDKIRYTSSAKKVASVSGKGVIKARKKGKAMITVRSGKKKIKIKVTVK